MERRGVRKSFTLIELLIVIAIISIASAFILFSVKNAQSRGRDAQRAADLAKMNSAIQMYYRETGNYPAKLNDLLASKYLTVVPTDPGSGSYQYLTGPTGIFCYKIIVTKPENPTLTMYKSIWDPAHATSWADYSRGCETLEP